MTNFSVEFDLPAVDEIDIFSGDQVVFAEKLTRILQQANDDTLHSGWLIRSHWARTLPGPTGAPGASTMLGFGSAVALAAYETVGLSHKRTSKLIDVFCNTPLGMLISDLSDYSQGPEDILHWQRAVEDGVPDLAYVVDINKDFVPRLFMLGTENTVYTLTSLLHKAHLGMLSPDLEIFVGEGQIDPDDKFWRPEDNLGEIEKNLQLYRHLGKVGHSAIEPENLVGTVASYFRHMEVS